MDIECASFSFLTAVVPEDSYSSFHPVAADLPYAEGRDPQLERAVEIAAERLPIRSEKENQVRGESSTRKPSRNRAISSQTSR